MMQYASVGVRNATRKASNVLVHNKGHGNGHGGSTAVNSRRGLHVSSGLFNASQNAAPNAIPNLASIRPRNPGHKLFSASRNFFQRFITHLTTPGFRAPTLLNQAAHSSRSLYTSNLQRFSIQSGFSLPVRHALNNSALQRQAHTFLPRGNGPLPMRAGGVAQVGLNTARNFSTGRPIFQHLAENVPVACRALYEVDFDLKAANKRRAAMRDLMNTTKPVQRSRERVKAKQTPFKVNEEVNREPTTKEELEHYFSADVPAVSTYLLIPLAPTPTSRHPLPHNLVEDDVDLLPPLSELGAIRTSHSTHALRVSSLFTRLDQANVWARGVTCSAYSQGQQYRRRQSGSSDSHKEESIDTGTCTVLKVEFVGWTKAEVRGVIGESGAGWCVLKEVWHDESSDDDFSDTDSVASAPEERSTFVDPAQSLVLPILDHSTSGTWSPAWSSQGTSPASSTMDMLENDPWSDLFLPHRPTSTSSSFSEAFVDPPSLNGFYQRAPDNHIGLVFGSQFDDATSSVSNSREMLWF